MELPYRAEYAKSGRSSCKSCRTPISKDELRLAVMVQSPMFDGKVPHWYHFSCFFSKQRVKSAGDISHYESLRWEDQERIKAKLSGGPSTPSAGSSSSSPKENGSSKKANKRRGKDKSLEDFTIEYSKSNRATCRACEEKIVKQDIRAAKKDYESDEGRRYGGILLWHHLECFVKVRQELEFWESGSKLPGFKTLEPEDQAKVEQMLPQIEPVTVKKEEYDELDGAEPPKKPKKENSNIIRKQNEEMFRYRDQLKVLSKKHLITLLEYNDQEIPQGTESILDRLADVMTFGALAKCTDCKHGQFVFRTGLGYYCLGNKTEWVKCEATTDDPARKPFRIPAELKEKYDFLNSYKYKPQKRVIQAIQPSQEVKNASNSSFALKSIKSEPSTSSGSSGPKVVRNLPLKNMEFFPLGKLPLNKEDLKLKIMKLGGKLATKLTSETTAIISTPGQLKGSSKHLETAKTHQIQLIPVEFLDECEKPGTNAILNITKMNFAPWGSDPTNRMNFEIIPAKSAFSKSQFKSCGPSRIKLKVKDGVAVDPDSGLENVAHVYQFNNDVYNATLSLTDVQTGRNSFYKLQILESDDKKTYWLFRSWGRIGTTIGNKKLEIKANRQEAIDEFKFLFEDKTANMWDNRKNFVKVPGKLNWVDVTYDDDEGPKTTDIPSKLEKPVQDLVTLIFNVDAMKNVLLEFELDTEKMPLGKLSKSQIKEAYRVLTQLQDLINSSGEKINPHTLVAHTNHFYTLIPHDFGIDNPPLLSNLEAIKQKVEMMDTLLEIEIAYSILRDTKTEGGNVHFIDSYYLKLEADIGAVDRESPEFKTIQLYVQNTHAETHRSYDLEIDQIFKVRKRSEEKRYKPFRKLHNRKLLWHGSRLTNFAGILSQGLRIAPPEAPVTGYMFGKGVYFADMVSKSANYCMTNMSNNIGLVLLCEVALGNMYERTHAEHIEKLPKGMHSVKGLGQTEPASNQSIIREDGVEIPLGKGVRCDRNTSLLYNEYIVYDVAQVKLDYLVQLKFHYK